MPPAIPIIAGVAAGLGTFAGGVGIVGLSLLQSALLVGFATAALSAIQTFVLAPSPPSLDGAARPFAARAQARTQTLRQAAASRRLPFGEVIVGGVITFYEATGDNAFHHLVVTLGDAPAAPWGGIDVVWLDDTPVFASEIDAQGNVVSGKFDGKVLIKKHLGGPDQTADVDLVSAIQRLDASFRGRGVAYLYLRIDWDRDTFPNGLPGVRALCRANTPLDPRDGQRRWTPNAALALHEYLTSTDAALGLEYDPARDFDGAVTISAANICDEIVAAKAVGHAVIEADPDSDELRLAVRASGAPLRIETGDRVELFLETGATAPAGLATGTSYFAIVDRLVGAPIEDGEDTTIQLSAGDYSGAAATAVAAGDVDATFGEGIHAAVRLATSYADALARQATNVTGAGSGQAVLIKTGEPRYALSGIHETDSAPNETIENMLSAMAGKLVWTGGVFRILPAAWRPPAAGLEFAEGDLVGAITHRPKRSRRERFNAVRGLFAPLIAVGEVTDYPPVIDDASAAADGRRIWATRDREWTSRPATAQRLSKIDLARARREKRVGFPAGPKGLRAVPGGTIALSNARRGWAGKTFEVMEQEDHEFGDDEPKLQGVMLRLAETDAAVFAFDPDNDEIVKAPEALPPGGNPLKTPANPTSLAAFTDTITDPTGAEQHRALLTWQPPADRFVVGGGQIEIQWKRSAGSLWQPSFVVEGSETQTLIASSFEDGLLVDFRMRSKTSLGRRAAQWQQLLGFEIGTAGTGATGVVDYGLITESVTGTVDFGLITESVTGVVDHGSLV